MIVSSGRTVCISSWSLFSIMCLCPSFILFVSLCVIHLHYSLIILNIIFHVCCVSIIMSPILVRCCPCGSIGQILRALSISAYNRGGVWLISSIFCFEFSQVYRMIFTGAGQQTCNPIDRIFETEIHSVTL